MALHQLQPWGNWTALQSCSLGKLQTGHVFDYSQYGCLITLHLQLSVGRNAIVVAEQDHRARSPPKIFGNPSVQASLERHLCI